METYVIQELTKIKEIDFIYCNEAKSDENMTIKYTIVVNMDNLIDNMDLFSNISKIMETAKNIVYASGKSFDYHFITKKNMVSDIVDHNQELMNELVTANILYSKDAYYIGSIVNYKQKAKKKK